MMKALFATMIILFIVFSTSATGAAETGSVKIIELNNKTECVLIKNEGASAVNLKGWQLHDQEKGKTKKHVYTFKELQLKPGEVLQIQSGVSKKDQESSPAPQKLDKVDHYVLWTSARIWNDSGDIAYLRDGQGNIVDQKQSNREVSASKKK